MCEQSRELANIFDIMANGLEIQNDHPRGLAYRRAAENLRALEKPLEQIQQAEKLETIPGIDKSLAGEIAEYLHTGRLTTYKNLQDQIPMSLLELLEIPGMKPHRARIFWEKLGIISVDDLRNAASTNQLRSIKGVGPRTEQKILNGIRAWMRQRTGRIPLGVAWPLVQEILQTLRDVPGTHHAEPAGSLRRMRETLGDLDLIAAGDNPDAIMQRFRSLPMVENVIHSGAAKTSIHTIDGMQVNLMVFPLERWGSVLQYFTGSQAHNVRLRTLAQQMNLNLSEHGFIRTDDTHIIYEQESKVYQHLHLPWIPPELREGRGELTAAAKDELPRLVKRSEIQGDFQCHTSRSDGDHSLETMVRAAEAAGLRYLIVADHAANGPPGKGFTQQDIPALLAEISQINARMAGQFQAIAGVEVNIQADGSLNWPQAALAKMEFVVASIHTDYSLSQHQMTERLLSAIRNPYVDMIGHPTGRLIGHREASDIDMESVFKAARDHGTALEINAWPLRLDLNDSYIRRAVELGVPLAISSDAHDAESFVVLDFGVAMARRGWCSAAQLLNTRSAAAVRRWREERLHKRGI